MRILYAEDEEALAMAVEAIFRKHGHVVETVYDGEAALEKALQNNNYDVAVFDVLMPKMDGVSALRKMREAGNYVPVLLLTAKSQVEDRIAGLKAGADDYLAKPFSVGELMARLEALSRRKDYAGVKNLSGGNVTLDCENNEVSTVVGSLVLSARETALLSHFLRNLNVSLEETELFDVLKTRDDSFAVKLYVTYLKNKLRQIHANLMIEQLGGYYRLVVQ